MPYLSRQSLSCQKNHHSQWCTLWHGFGVCVASITVGDGLGLGLGDGVGVGVGVGLGLGVGLAVGLAVGASVQVGVTGWVGAGV